MTNKTFQHKYAVGDVVWVENCSEPVCIIKQLFNNPVELDYEVVKASRANNYTKDDTWYLYQDEILQYLYSKESAEHINDPINPNHYKTNSIECIEIAELFPYTLGNAIKYAWRAGLKDDLIQDLNKCLWYLNRAIDNGDDFVNEKVFGLARRKFNQIDSNEFKRYRHHYAILQYLILTDVEQAREYLIQAIQHLQDTPE